MFKGLAYSIAYPLADLTPTVFVEAMFYKHELLDLIWMEYNYLTITYLGREIWSKLSFEA